jgi:hypothetical protein
MVMCELAGKIPLLNIFPLSSRYLFSSVDVLLRTAHRRLHDTGTNVNGERGTEQVKEMAGVRARDTEGLEPLVCFFFLSFCLYLLY